MDSISHRWRALLVVLACASFWPTLKLGFVWDDHWVIERTVAESSPSFKTLAHDFQRGIFRDPNADFYRPLQLLIHQATFWVFGLKASAFHAVNLAVHAINSVLLAELLILLGAPGGAAVLSAALFAVHPVIVSELIMVSGLSEVLGLTWMFATLLAIFQRSLRGLVLAIVFFSLGLLTKESVTITPIIGLLIAALERDHRAMKRSGTLLLVLLPYSVWYFSHPRWTPPAGFSAALVAHFAIKAWPGILLHYAFLLIWPWPLYSDRSVPAMAGYWGWNLTFWIFFVAVLWRVRLAAAWLCAGTFAIVLLPKSYLMITHSRMLDHWAYPAAPAILFPIGWALWRLISSRRDVYRWVGVSLGTAAILAGISLAHVNIQLRGTDERLYRWTLRFENSPIMSAGLEALQGRPALR